MTPARIALGSTLAAGGPTRKTGRGEFLEGPERLHVGRRQTPLGRRNVRPNLFRCSRLGNYRADNRLTQQPTEREIQQGVAALRGKAAERGDPLEVARRHDLGGTGAFGKPAASGSVGHVLAAQKPGLEREVGDHSETVSLTGGDHLAGDSASQ